jgi:hypothetical protein
MGRLAVLFLTGTGLLLAQPQARTIVYSRVGPSQIQLFVSNADGTAERPFLLRRKVNGEVWLPAVVSYKGSARVGLLVTLRRSGTSEFSGYRKYSVNTFEGFSRPK